MNFGSTSFGSIEYGGTLDILLIHIIIIEQLVKLGWKQSNYVVQGDMENNVIRNNSFNKNTKLTL